MVLKLLTPLLPLAFISVLIFWLCYFHWSFTKKLARLIILAIVILCVLAGLGYLSNGISRTPCERIVVERIAKDVVSHSFFIPADSHPHLTKALSHFNFNVKRCPKPIKESCFPLVIIDPADIWKSPFVVSVEWAYAPRYGDGTGMKTQFLCFFGWVIPVAEHLEWIE